MPRFIEKETHEPLDSSFLMGTDKDGTDGKYSFEALKNFFGTSSELESKINSEITARTQADSDIYTTIERASGILENAIDDVTEAVNIINGTDKGLSMREVAQSLISTVYSPQGSIAFANLPALSSAKIGYVYDILDDFTTTSDFREGAGIEVPAGTNIVVTDVNGVKKWDLLGFNIDLSPYQKKILTTPVMVDGTQKTTVEDAITALAEAESSTTDGLPIGSIIPIYSVIVPVGFLPCDGSQYDTTQYPSLYALLGSDRLPDLRESTLVGIGTSDRTDIAAHDVYTLGQFKDDQVGAHQHSMTLINRRGDASYNREGGWCGDPYSDGNWTNSTTAISSGRHGTTTHGKQTGVFFVIKAV
jgi:hypothetical protein